MVIINSESIFILTTHKSTHCFNKGQKEADKCWPSLLSFTDCVSLNILFLVFLDSLFPIYKTNMVISNISLALKCCHLMIINDYHAATAVDDSKTI